MNGQNLETGPDPGTGHEPPQGARPGRLERFAWLPIPLLAAAIIVARAAGLSESYTSEPLTLILSFAFYTLVTLGTIFLIGRGFLALGTPGLLLLECGVILWSLAGTMGDAVSHGDANLNVTIFNTGILLAGLCHLAGAILSLRPQRTLRPPLPWLVAGCALSLGALWLVTQAAMANWLPVFFIPGHGGTPVRYCVLISAIAMFVLSACLLLASRRGTHLPFTSWYALALLLLAVGLFGVMIQLSLGSVVNWLGRMAQWLAGVYLLLAAVAALRGSHLPLLPLETRSHTALYRNAMAVVIVLAAAAVRLTFLSALGTRAPYVVFFPAVMFAAIYGGRRGGLLATGLSAMLAYYFWIAPAGRFALGEPADWLGLAIFLLSGCMIAWIAEALHQTRARASAAETQALLAAEREAAAELLRKSEEQYHTLFTGMTEGFALHELLTDESGRPVDYRFLDVNPAFERLTGLERRDVVGRTHSEVLPGEDPKWLQMYGQVALTGQPAQFENYAPVLKRHYEVFAYRPAQMQFAVVFMDITERKQAVAKMREARAAAINLMEDAIEARQQTEQANEKLRLEIAERKQAEDTLQTTVQRFQNILLHIFDGILVLTEDDRIEFANQSFCEQFDVAEAPSALIGLTAAEMLQKVSSAYADPEASVARIRQILSQGGRIEDEEVLMRSGRVFLRDYNPILVDGKPHGRMWQHRDITERKKMEDELRKSRDELELRVHDRTAELVGANQLLRNQATLLDLAHDAILVRGMDDTVKFWNSGAVETYGFLREEATGKTLHELLQTEFPEPLDTIKEHVARTGQWEGELKQAASSGEELIVESRWALQTDRNGMPLGYLEINRDITARKHAEAALRSNMARLELVNAELQEFAFVASHDLQEPLRKIQTFCDLVQKRCAPVLDSTGQEYLERVINSASRMRRLLSDLLQFSRVAARPESFKKMDLVKIAREAADVFEETVNNTGALVDIDSMPAIEADESQMLRLFQNLIGNALKFRNKDNPKVKVHGRLVGPGLCEIIVEDNGIGFEQQFAELIFKPFQRLHGRGEYDGTGMGLAICRKIVERHGGSIRAESKPGEGSTFIILVPVRQINLESLGGAGQLS